mgnify:CR=1 FL=1
MLSKDVLEVQDSNFKELLKSSKEVVMVDFWAPWCGPCKMVGPVVEEIAKLYKGKIKVGKINIDDNSDTANEYSVMSIPTLILFKDGKELTRLIGALPKDKLISKIEEALNA